MKPIVLSLCDYTGNMVLPWAEAGHECYCVDIQHPFGTNKVDDNIYFVGADVCLWCPPLGKRIAFVSAFPPCTDLAVSGSRWFKTKGLERLARAIQVVASCERICVASEAPYFIENPVSTLSSYWRKPDFSFSPCDYAGWLSDPGDEAYTKKTCLWVGGGFVMPETIPVEPVLGSLMHYVYPSEDRQDIRSKTPLGFARAVFESNKRVINE